MGINPGPTILCTVVLGTGNQDSTKKSHISNLIKKIERGRDYIVPKNKFRIL
jgi:hypothetical protein